MKNSLLFLISLFSSLAYAQNISILEVGRFTDGRDGACEISAYDAASQKLFITNAAADSVDIIDVTNFATPVRVGNLDILSYGGGVNSVATVGNGHVAVAIEANNKQDSGVVAFYTTAGVYVTHVKVGALPDMLKLTPDGNNLLVANEGEPNDDYNVDPQGSVSIIDISGGIGSLNQSNVSFVDFTAYNGQEATLRAQGALIFGKQPIVNEGLFFSEYMEGSSNNKYMEIYNATDSTVYLDTFAFPNVSNAPTTIGDYEFWNTFPVGDSILAGDVYIIAHPSANATILAQADHTFTFMSNGNDGFALVHGNSTNYTVVDYLGDFNGDPGTGWDVAGVTNATANHTLVRKPTIGKGNNNWVASAGTNAMDSEWEVYPIDSIVSLGTHTVYSYIASSVAQDLEPEYIASDSASTKAYVACQENNALAIIDLATATIDTIVGLGFKDFNATGNGMDASNKDNMINIQNWNVKGVYQPDAMDMFRVNGINYLITANEGDARDYDGYSAETRIKDLTLDPIAFPNAATLQANTNLGRLNSFTPDVIGDTDADGDIDELYAYGARSFSIWDDAGNLVWDSGDQFEQYIAANHPDFFNCDDGLAAEKDERSDDKGPEPEAIVAGKIGANTYAFIGLERQGGIMVYDVSNPTNPVFETFVNNYNASTGTMVDIAPEGLIFIPAANSHNGNNMLIVSNEVSGTTTIYEVSGLTTSAEEFSQNEFSIYPNPVNELLTITGDEISSVFITDMLGRVVIQETIKNKQHIIDVSDLIKGIYFVNILSEGVMTTKKVIKN